jgi:hypothetical protein
MPPMNFMNKKSVSLILFLMSTSAFGQPPSGNRAASIDRAINYVTKINTIATDWTNAPEKVAFRKMLQDAVQTYDQVKKDITPVLIVSGSDADKKELQRLLDSHGRDREKLIDELLLWKYQPRELTGDKITYQLDEFTEQAMQILLYFNNDDDLENITSVLLSQDIVENKMLPLSKELIRQLTMLKQGK